MISQIRIQNFRSFIDAQTVLRPFNLIVGANGTGKSNFLRAFKSAYHIFEGRYSNAGSRDPWRVFEKHINHTSEGSTITAFRDNRELDVVKDSELSAEPKETGSWIGEAQLFNIDPNAVSAIESAIPKAIVKGNGAGTAQVLDMLKNGDREDLFMKIEENFRRCVPEVEKLSLRTVEQGKKQIQVRERGLNGSVLSATELSEGTRLILALLTIIHQESPPPIILLEDIDRGLHPRLFEFVAPLMKDIAERNNVNILATTHNPYLVDCFQNDKEAVIIVEKKDGASTLSTLADRLAGLDYDKVDPEDMPLGNLWFSGLVGGVPAKLTHRPER